MADVKIIGQVEVDASKATKGLKDLNAQIAESKRIMSESKKGSEEWVKANDLLKQSQAALAKSTADKTTAFGALKDRLTSTIPALKGAESGGYSFLNMLKALAVNPIILILTAIVAALKFLYDAFTSTKAGGEKVEQVFNGIKAAIQVVVDRVFALGRAIIKFFSGDFKGAAEDAAKAVTGIGDEIEAVYDKTVELTRKLQKIRDEERQDALDKSAREKRLALLREQLNDEDVSAKEKLRIAQELRDDQIKNAEEDRQRTIEKNNALIAQIRLKKELTAEDLDQINQYEIEKNKVETENALEGVRTNKVIQRIKKQINQENVEAYKASLERQKAAEEEYLANIEKLEQQHKVRMQQIENEKKLFTVKAKDDSLKVEMTAIQNRAATEIKAIADVERREREATANKIAFAKMEAEQRIGSINAVMGATDALSNLIGRQTAVGKGLAIATSLINVYQGVTEALKQKSTLPSPFDVIAKVANVATVLATGLSAVKAITRVNVPGGGGGASVSAEGLTAAAPVLPSQSSTSLDNATIQAVGNAANSGSARNYVLEHDVATGRERIERINRAARLG